MKCLKILYHPKRVYDEIDKNTDWGIDYIILSFILVLVAFFSLPVNSQIFNNMAVFQNLSSKQVEMAKSVANKMQYMTLILEPIIFIIKLLFLSCLLYFGVVICKGNRKFKEIFSLSMAASSIVVLSSIVNLFVLYFKGIENIKSLSNIYVIGLNVFFEINSIGFPLYQFFTNINFFEIWYIIILIFGISKICDVANKKASLIVIFAWLVLVTFNVVQTTLSNMSM